MIYIEKFINKYFYGYNFIEIQALKVGLGKMIVKTLWLVAFLSICLVNFYLQFNLNR